MEKYDVIVAGAGPAGCVVAIILARAQRSVLLIERRLNMKAQFRSAETLPGAGIRILRELELEHILTSPPHLPNYGMLSCWGSEESQTFSSLLDPYGYAWSIDRPSLDNELRRQAVLAGAQLEYGSRVLSLKRELNGWRGFLKINNSSVEVQASLLIDASGRSASISKMCGAQRKSEEGNVSIEGRYTSGIPGLDETGLAMIEAVADGWWFSTKLASGHRHATFFTDSRLFKQESLHEPENLRQKILASNELKKVFESAIYSPVGKTKVRLASSERLNHFAQKDWFAIGDAAISFDPISSRGLFHALYSAYYIGNHLVQKPQQIESFAEQYDAHSDQIYRKYHLERKKYYRLAAARFHTSYWDED